MGVRAIALLVDAPSLGQVRLVVRNYERGNDERLVTNHLMCELARRVRRTRRRWRSETIVGDAKRLAGVAAGEHWVEQALVRRITLVFLAFVVLQALRRAPQDTVDAVKVRRQGAVLRDGQTPAYPLRATPHDFPIKST